MCSFFRFGGGRPLHRVQFLIFSLRDLQSEGLLEYSAGGLLILKPPVLSCDWIRHTSAAFRIHATSLPERSSFSGSTGILIPGLILPLFLFDRQSFMTSFLELCHFCIAGRPYSGGSELLSPSTIFQDPNFPDDVLSRHATVARRDTFLQAAANFLLDPQ
jgi:hypothetical protein